MRWMSLVLLGMLAMSACRDGALPEWRREADLRIERHRKGDFALTLVDADGTPLAAELDLRLDRHHFEFGTCVNGRLFQEDADGERYRRFVLDHFNSGVAENSMKWYATEKERGKLDYETADRIAEFCAEHDLSLRGHCLFWSREKFVKWQAWLLELEGDELRAAVRERIERIVPRYRSQVTCWDVNNEMLDGEFYASRAPGIRAEMFERAHALDPDAPLFCNEFGILGVEDKRDRYLELIAGLHSAGAPVGGIGIQEHACERFTTARQAAGYDADETEERVMHESLSPEDAIRDLDLLAATGLRIHLTEISCKTPDEEARAVGIETLLRVGFSHPAVDAILLWGFWARSHWLGPDAALVDADWQLTAAGERYVQLVGEEWSTHTAGPTAVDGTYAFRGFYGTYTGTATPADGTARPVRVELTPDARAARVVIE